MAGFLEHGSSLLTSEDLEMVAKEYILVQFKKVLDSKNTNHNQLTNGVYIDRNEEEKQLQYMIDNSNFQLRMYGSAKEFAEQLRIYRNFPESHKFFGINALNAYFTTPIAYRSLKNEQYICKSDVFICFQSVIRHVLQPWVSQVVRIMLTVSLKSQEERINGQIEFVRYDPKVFEEMGKEYRELSSNFHNNFSVLSNSRANLSVVDMLINTAESNIEIITDTLQKLIPTAWKEAETQRLSSLIRNIYNELEPFEMAMHYYTSKIAITYIQEIMNKRPEMFLPQSETENNKMPVIVRLFEDGGKLFMMKAELFQAMNTFSPERDSIDYCDQLHILEVIDLKKVLTTFNDRIKNIEFIRTPIMRSKHKAVPIKAPTSKAFCVLAVDALFEFLKRQIFGFKLFQRALISHREDCLGNLNRLGPLFRTDLECQYFLLLESFDSRMDQELLFFEQIPTNEVRNAKAEGFTVENLKNELKHLGLTEFFPEITDHAEIAYAEVVKKKKSKYLRTCDLFDAIEHCQLICIFNEVPNLKTFLHNQNACGRVPGLNCEICCGKPPSVENSQTKSQTPGDSVRTDDRKSNISDDDKKTETCEKCLRTEEDLEEASKKAEASRKEVEKMKKKVSAIEKELIDVKKKLDKTIDKMKKDLEKKNAEIEKLKVDAATHSKIANENEKLKFKILQCGTDENKLKEANSKQRAGFDKERAQLSDKITELKKGLESEKQKSVSLEQENIQLRKQSECDNKKEENDWIIEKRQLQEDILKFKTESEVNSRLVQNLLEKLAAVSIASVNVPMNPSVSDSTLQTSSDPIVVRNHVPSTPPVNENAPTSSSVKTSQKLKPKPTSSAEARSLLGNHGPPTSSANKQTSTSSKIPEKQAWNDQKTNARPDTELEDKTCVICHDEMESEEKTIKCLKCLRRFHSNCACEWAKWKAVCPMCREKLVDPNEFPSLS